MKKQENNKNNFKQKQKHEDKIVDEVENKNFDSQNLESQETNNFEIEIQNLKLLLEQKDEKIKKLEQDLLNFNNNYKSELIKKSQEANLIIEKKVKEYELKAEQEIKQAKKYALKNSSIELINIINNFELAVNNSPKNELVANYVKGFLMFVNMFKNFLEQNDIKEINVNLNDDFDPKIMEAIDTQKVENTSSNKVIKIIKKGYKLHELVIVPCLVIVSK